HINFNNRWISLKLIDNDFELINSLNKFIGYDINSDKVTEAIYQARKLLLDNGITINTLKEYIAIAINNKSANLFKKTVTIEKKDYAKKDRIIDKWLTNKWTGIPIMLTMLATIFWITIIGANYPSSWLFTFLFKVSEIITDCLRIINFPDWLISILIDGVYRVLAWVVAVMLPPMLIFFPLFTLLEDSGILPRIAFNLDKYFKKCHTCGKQALTMAMGFGCNAVGVTGCRIIDSPRERLIAMITNTFVPCNGRFPTLIAIIIMFFVGGSLGVFSSILNTLILVIIILVGILITLFISFILSKTILKGYPSSFILELPPYRKPQIGKVLIRSVLDRSIFVLGRAIMVAAPAGLLIWVLANINIGNISVINYCANFLNPFASIFGLDGTILLAFILGFPANEIVLPIMIMIYMSSGQIIELDNLTALKELLILNNWTFITAICVMLFSIMHWPCSTTCLTIKKESKSLKWTLISFLVPTITGFIVCFIVANILKCFFM
ncbi:MAG: nucleoside recognition domain-containing protein, partial [Bacilli bacterium]